MKHALPLTTHSSFFSVIHKILVCVFLATLSRFDTAPIHAKPKNKSNAAAENNGQKAAVVHTVVKKRKSKAPSGLYVKRRNQEDPFVKEQGGELLRSTAQLGLSAGLIVGFHQFTNKSFDLSTLLGPLIGNLLTDPIKAIGSACSMLFFPSLSKPRLKEAIALKKKYIARKNTFSPSIQGFIEHILNQHIWAVQRFDYYNDKDVAVVKELLQFPAGPKQVIPDIAAIGQFTRNYPEEVRVAVGEFVATIVEDAQTKQLTKKATPIMFVGPPGTGKTYLAKQLATLLQLPLHVIDIANYKNVHGSSYYCSDPEKGVIAEALTESSSQEQNWSNKILILDEIDKALAIDKNDQFISKNGAQVYSFLHTFLETQEVAIPLSRYQNACPDISQLKIILIANKTFTKTLTPDKAAALESRVKIIRFDQGFTLDKKSTIAATHIDKMVVERGIDRAIVNKDVVDAIIAEDTHLGLKGVRVLLNVIDQYLNLLKHEKLVSQISGKPIAPFDVQQAYAPYRPKADPLVNDSKLLNKNG